MRKALTGGLTVLLVGILSAVVFAAVDTSGDDPAPAATTTTTPKNPDARKAGDRNRARARDDDSTEVGGDISGPCDEAEHANDPRCAGSTAPSPPPAPAPQPAGDISGPCDEQSTRTIRVAPALPHSPRVAWTTPGPAAATPVRAA